MAYRKIVFVCPKKPQAAHHYNDGWGSYQNDALPEGKTFPELPDTELIRSCHGCSFKWPIRDDWKYFQLIVGFDSPAEYAEAEKQRAAQCTPSKSTLTSSVWSRLLG